jgi:hypothetical protein
MLFCRPLFFLVIAVVLTNSFILAGCDKDDDEEDCVYVDPFPFPDIPENNNGSRIRSVTYVYDRTAVDQTYPPKIDSIVIQFAFDAFGRIERIRLSHNDSFYVYDFLFERNNNRLDAIHCRFWSPVPCAEINKGDLELEYNASGKVSLMKASFQNNPYTEVDSFIIKYNSSGSRIDTVIDRSLAVGNNQVEKYAFTYNGAGDIIQMDNIWTSGVFWVVEEIYKYTLSATPAAVALGNEAIFWKFFAYHVGVSSVTGHMIPDIFFHSTKQPSKLELFQTGIVDGTSNYQTEYFSTGLPKKMTANVITAQGAFYAREAYYYTYTQ